MDEMCLASVVHLEDFKLLESLPSSAAPRMSEYTFVTAVSLTMSLRLPSNCLCGHSFWML